jgi:hypothetical protein
MNNPEQPRKGHDIQKRAFPRPGFIDKINEFILAHGTGRWSRKHTFTVNPQEGTSRLPFR